MTDNSLSSLRAIAAKESRRLAVLNRATLTIAVIVYSVIVIFCAINLFIPPIIFSSCVMVAELLVFQFVRTMLAHFAVARET
ncbi:MAG: hypothetical protein ACO321_07010 [Ilumatobacteraceae bacterium]